MIRFLFSKDRLFISPADAMMLSKGTLIVVGGGTIGCCACLANWKYFWPWTLKKWRSLVKEEVVSPEEEIVDAHHHFWDFANEEGRSAEVKEFANASKNLGSRLLRLLMRLNPDEGIKGFYNMHFGPARSMESFTKPWLAAEMKEDIGGHKVIASVYIQCGWQDDAKISEASYQLASRDKTGLPSAFVGSLMLADGAEKAEKTMDAALKDCRGDRSFLVGFRSMQNSAPKISDSANGGDPRPLDNEESIAAAKALGARGFPVDLCVFHNNLPAVAGLAQAAPGTIIVLDHIGIPVGKGSCAPFGKVLPEWRTNMTALSKCPNVRVKLSGMGMSVFGMNFDWGGYPPTSDALAAVWGPLVHFVIDTFGIDRCFFASNFPPDGVSCSYAVLWNAMKKIASKYSAADRRKLFRDNAVATYKLKL